VRSDFEEDARDIAQLLGDGAHLVGHSYGAIGALYAAALVPLAVRSLTVIEPPAWRLAGNAVTEARTAAFAAMRRDVEPRAFLEAFHRMVNSGFPPPPDPLPPELEAYLGEYIECGRLAEAGRAPLFQAIKYRPYGRGQAELNGERLDRINAWKMVRRRAKAAGITTEVCNHTFRGTGITAYLENGSTLEKARQMAAHASTHTTQLYDRREDRVTLDES
jgi:pimeloyl-ACP methyl ester carboxylesterase